jgi:hypothetical protein
LLNLSPESTIAIPKPKHSLLPVLVVLFLVSYGLMTMLIVEQGKTIDIQRYLIGQLFTDSNQLNAIRSRQAVAQSKARSQAQTPSSQAPPQTNKGKVRHSAPQKPPKDTSDSSDVRRSLVTI